MLLSLILQITEGAASTAASVPTVVQNTPKQDTLSLLDLIIKGGYIMIPIGVLSIISIYVLIEKYIAIRKAGKLNADFMSNVKDNIKKGTEEVKEAMEISEESDSFTGVASPVNWTIFHLKVGDHDLKKELEQYKFWKQPYNIVFVIEIM